MTIRWQSTAIVAYIALAIFKPATETVCQQGSLMTCIGGRAALHLRIVWVSLNITQLASDHNAWAIPSSSLSSSWHEVHSHDTEILPYHSPVCWMNCNLKVTRWLLSYSLSSCLAQVLSSNMFTLIFSPICSLHQLCANCFHPLNPELNPIC
jgi:hypothetical protein